MKKLSFVALISLSIFSMVACQEKNLGQSENNEIPLIEGDYQLNASIIQPKPSDTGTISHWKSGDELIVGHSGANSNQFISDIFLLQDPSKGLFSSSTLDVTTLSKSNDWIVFFSDASDINSDGSVVLTLASKKQIQKGENMDHLVGKHCPLSGSVLNQSANEFPQISMKHLAGFLDLEISNDSKSNLPLDKVLLKVQGKAIQGKFTASIAKNGVRLMPVAGQTSENIEISSDLILKPGQKSHLYLAVAPLMLNPDEYIEISIGECIRRVVLENPIKSGIITPISFSYDKDMKQKFDANSWLGDGLTFNDGIITIPGGNTATLNKPGFGTWNFHISNIQTTSMNVRFRFTFKEPYTHVNWGMWTDGSTDTWANMNINWDFKPGGKDQQVAYKNEYTFTMKVVPSDKAGALDFKWSLDGNSYGTYTLIAADWNNLDISIINSIIIETTDSGSISLDWWEFEPYI